MTTETEFERGDRVMRVSHLPPHRAMYEATIHDVSVRKRDGRSYRFYQLTDEAGNPSPIKVRGNVLRRIE